MSGCDALSGQLRQVSGTLLGQGTFAVTAKNARIGEQRLEHGAPPWERHTTMFISDYVVKSPPITAQARPSGRLRHIIKFATYRILN